MCQLVEVSTKTQKSMMIAVLQTPKRLAIFLAIISRSPAPNFVSLRNGAEKVAFLQSHLHVPKTSRQICLPCSEESLVLSRIDNEEADIMACIAYGAEMSRERFVDIPLQARS